MLILRREKLVVEEVPKQLMQTHQPRCLNTKTQREYIRLDSALIPPDSSF